MSDPELRHVIDAVVKDKGIDRAIIIAALEGAMLNAARKKFGPQRDIEAHFNEEIAEIELFEFKEVVDEIEDESTHIILEEARHLDPEAQVGDSLGLKLDTTELGRIAAQTAKQVIIQRLRDAEKDIIYEEFKDRLGEIVYGIVRRFERKDMIVDLGKTEAMLSHKEQIPRESFRPGDRIRALIIEIQRESRGPQVVLSRTSPAFLAKLFETEVPEIYEGIVTIESVAREPGSRSKIAVRSNDSDVDPVGACVGMKGSRVQGVVQELRGEKIDIVPWSDNIATNVVHALSPAEVMKVILDEKNHSMEVVVPDDQLSLAIGRKGQNVRLAVELTGWNIDIKSESEVEEQVAAARKNLVRVEGVGELLAEVLIADGYRSVADVAEAEIDELSALPGIDEKTATVIKKSATELVPILAEEEKQRREQEEAEAAAVAEAEAETEAQSADAESAGEIDEEKAEEEDDDEHTVSTPAESEAADAPPKGIEELDGKIGPKILESLKEAGFSSIEDLIEAGEEGLIKVEGIGSGRASKIMEAVKEIRSLAE